MDLVIKRLNKDMIDDYLHFFDDIAFCDNPEWSRCYCNHFYFSDPNIEETITKEESRSCVIDRILTGGHSGFMAFIGKEPVGWINAGKKTNYGLLMDDESIISDNDEKIASIVCFIVDKNHRGKGIANALLNHASQIFESEGFECIEAYPIVSPRNHAENYHGPMKMYLNNNFEVIKDMDRRSLVVKRFK